MKFEQIKEESPDDFRRLTGMKRTPFDVMVSLLRDAEAVLKSYGGKPNKRSIVDRWLMPLEHLGAYRTYFHISRSYGIRERSCYRSL